MKGNFYAEDDERGRLRQGWLNICIIPYSVASALQLGGVGESCFLFFMFETSQIKQNTFTYLNKNVDNFFDFRIPCCILTLQYKEEF